LKKKKNALFSFVILFISNTHRFFFVDVLFDFVFVFCFYCSLQQKRQQKQQRCVGGKVTRGSR
jgi:preprotein translocase subunit YajC